jgi:hypothetical protein
MSMHNPEENQQPSLTEQVMATCREAYDTLRTILEGLPYEGGEDRSPELEVLSQVVGTFVAANSVALGNICEVPKTPELQEAAGAWLEARLQRKLKSAMLLEISKQKEAEIQKLLEGRNIKARSLKYAFGVSDGYGITTEGGTPMEVEAPFLGVEPAKGTLWLGEPRHAYQVRLFDTQDPTKSAAVIEVQ